MTALALIGSSQGAFGGGRVQVGDGRGEALDVHDVERVFDARLQRSRAGGGPEGLAVPIGGCPREESRGARREGRGALRGPSAVHPRGRHRRHAAVGIGHLEDMGLIGGGAGRVRPRRRRG